MTKVAFWWADGFVIDRLTVTKTDVSRLNVAEKEFGLWCVASTGGPI